VAEALVSQEEQILSELASVQGAPADLQGYYHAPLEIVDQVMRPSATLNAVIDA